MIMPALNSRDPKQKNANRFADKTVLITGGAGGMGAAAAIGFAREGARVAILDKSTEAGGQLAATLRSEGGTAEFFEVDLARTRDIESVIDRVSATYGPADVLFNHAGIVEVAPFTETSLEQFDAVININLRASFVVCQRVVREMAANGGGAIVISSSIGASHAFQFESVYCMTKAAVLMLAKSIAIEHRHQGIRANAVCPGFVRTAHGLREIELFDKLGQTWDEAALQATQGRMCEPNEVAWAVMFLASPEASFINGAGLYIDNGWAVKG
jgi:NAD(P)-dependent dehydrogenase (short-subunit alcohol dehydrogenase family)